MRTRQDFVLCTVFTAAAFVTASASAQNVGIGTTTPKSKLSVNGTTASGGMAIGDATYTNTTGTIAPLNGAMIQGRVGIGTTNPLMRLHLEGDGTNLNTSLIIKSLAAVPELNAGTQVLLRSENHAALPLDAIFGRFLVQSPGDTVTNNTGMDVHHRGLAGTGNGLSAITFRTVGTTGSLERMRIAETGNVGIGDSTPTEAQLVVRGAESGNITGGRTQFSYNSSLIDIAGTFAIAPSIYASSAIVAEGNLIAGISVISANTITLSDSRLKNVVRESNGASDLETLGKIRITDYTMKDPSVLGGGEVKKVIAQQVEEVYPQAVTKTTGYLPDIYAPAKVAAKGDGLFEFTCDKAHNLKASAKVKLVSHDGQASFATVETADDKSFTAKLEKAPVNDEIFVYGRQVGDLRTVDYEAISMLNVSATQELARKVAALEAENAKLKADNAELSTVAADVKSLKEAVATMQRDKGSGAVSTVALTR